MGMPGVAVVVLAGVLVAGCSSGASGDGSPASTAAPATASPAARDLGPDRIPEEYRALDLCALVDLPAVLAAAGDEAPDLEEEKSGIPGTCRAEGADGSGGYVFWTVAQPRKGLPTAVTAPSEVTEDVDTTAEGEVITDKACSMAHVVSAAYVLLVHGPSPAKAGECAVLRGVGDALRDSLATGPAPLSPAGPPATGDLCAALTASGLAEALDAEVAVRSADHRDCEVEADGVVLVSMLRTPARDSSESGEAAPKHGDVFRTEDGCAVKAFADDGTVDGGYWITVTDRDANGNGCETTVELRAAAAAQMFENG